MWGTGKDQGQVRGELRALLGGAGQGWARVTMEVMGEQETYRGLGSRGQGHTGGEEYPSGGQETQGRVGLGHYGGDRPGIQ